ncbi:MAG: hypothetical protein WA937_13000 [Flavobacteriales bacterium]
MERTGPVRADGSLSEATIILLHAVSQVDLELLRAVRIRPSRSNWFRAPWYRYHRGGAITIGRTIWFTFIWFAPDGSGDGSLRSTWKWLLHLAHEVGHLPQAERFGRSLWGKARYVAAFTWQYGSRALLLRRPIHDGSRLEREADLGRQVLMQLIGQAGSDHPVVTAIHEGDAQATRKWCAQNTAKITALAANYREHNSVSARS